MSIEQALYALAIATLIAWPCSGQLSADERSQIITSHNGIRSSVQPEAQNMLEMIYDNTLEYEAQQIADDCNYNDAGVSGKFINFVSVPENEATWEKTIKKWGDEKANYKYETNTCTNGEVCKHYLQVVWAAAMKAGCAQKTCPKSGSNTVNMVCVYDKGKSDQNEKPYVSGNACGQCPSKYQNCQNKLCSANLPIETTTSSTTWVSFSGGLVMMALIITGN
nr:hypothetical protein HmN_000896000 [Hymenolepis microstoma]